MNRRIMTTRLHAMGGETEIDTYFDKVVKYIPADIVGAWVAVTGLLASTTEPSEGLLWVAFAIGVILTAMWVWRQTTMTGRPVAITQIAVSTVAFGVWVFALGGPFRSLPFYSPLYGSVVLILYTLLVALINPPEG
jgi:hypothetical protein